MTEPQSQELRKEIEKAVKKFLEAGGDPEFYIISKSYYDKNIEKLIQTQADKKMLEIIGKNEKQLWDGDYHLCDRCSFQPTDDTKNCMCIYRNQLREELRAKVKSNIGDSDV